MSRLAISRTASSNWWSGWTPPDSRLGHLEAIERGLADLLVHIEDMRSNKETAACGQKTSPGIDALKHDIARTQDTSKQ